MRSTTAFTIIAASAALLLQGPGAAVAATPAAVWHLDETTGSVAADASGNENDGQVFEVRMGVPSPSGTAYRFNGTSSKVVVPSSPSLNPGGADFSYTVVVRFTQAPPTASDTYDLMRKGISAASGGEYKLEIANVKGVARARCLAKDSAGHLARETLKTPTLADGQWHTITCARHGATWRTTVDSFTSSDSVTLGTISNTKTLTLGTKLGGKTGGDWFQGDMDEARLDIG